MAFLISNGRAYRAPGVIVWAPVDSLDAGWLAVFTDSLSRAVASLKTLIGSPYPWQRIHGQPIEFYLSPGRFVSHASGRGAVFLSLNSVRKGYSPFLHETAHELLAPPAPFYPFEAPDSLQEERVGSRFPFWLSEGLADYLAQSVAESTGFREGDVFEVGGLARSDSVCAARLSSSPRRPEIVARLGRQGWLDALYTSERAEVAPIYYACSQAFTRYLVSRIGVRSAVAILAEVLLETWLEDLSSAAGEPLEAVRQQWLTTIGIQDSP